jgi:hypothetical protein
MNTIKINGIDYKIKYTIRALFIFEQITGKAFKIETLLDNYIFFYAMILANNETVLDWDAFLDALDENPTLFAEMNETVAEQQKKDNIFNNEESDTEEKKS